MKCRGCRSDDRVGGQQLHAPQDLFLNCHPIFVGEKRERHAREMDRSLNSYMLLAARYSGNPGVCDGVMFVVTVSRRDLPRGITGGVGK